MPGPIPKASAERRRRNKESRPDTLRVTGRVAVPEGDEDWHPVASRWYVALKESAQAQVYEPSDWATAYLIAESLSRDLNPQVVGVTDSGKVVTDVIPMKGASLSAYLRAMSVLMVTEGDRRRARYEIERSAVEAVPATVSNLDDHRSL